MRRVWRGVVLSVLLLPVLWVATVVFVVVFTGELAMVLDAVAVVVIGWPIWIVLAALGSVTAVVAGGSRATSYAADVVGSLVTVVVVGTLVWVLWGRVWLVEQLAVYIPGSVIYLLCVAIVARHTGRFAASGGGEVA